MNRLYALLFAGLLFSATVLAQEELADVSIALPTVAAQTGQEICLDVTSDNLDGVFGLQLSIAFDPAALTFQNITNLNLPEATLDRDFNTTLAGEGKISMLWTNLGSATYAKPFTLFSICFRVTGTAESIVPIRFTNDPVAMEVISNSGPLGEEFTQGVFTNGAVWIRSGALPPLPSISAVPSVVSCDDSWRAGLDITVTGGAPPYLYNWSGPGNFESSEEDLPVVPFGVYSLTVTDQNGAPASATFYLAKPQSLGAPPPLVTGATITGAASCINPDGSIALELSRAAGSFAFAWSNGATTQNISGLQPGFYEVSIADEYGCTGYWSGIVPPANDFDIVVVEQPAVCTQSPGRLEIASPTGAAYQYTWFDGSDGATVDNLLPGSYGLTVTDVNSGCVKTLQPQVSAQGNIPLTVNAVQPDCAGAPGSISLQLPGGLPFGIEWNNGAETAQLNNLPPGNYSATITDETAGCVREERIVLQSPAISLTIDTDCRLNQAAPDSVYVTVTPFSGEGPYTFNWSNGETTVSEGSSTLGAALPTVLFATVTDQEGCTGYSPLPAICREEDRPGKFNATLYYECAGQLAFTAYVRDGGSPPYTFKWNNGFEETADQSSTTVITGRNYRSYTSVTITDATGESDFLIGFPLPDGVCQELSESVGLVVPDTIVETDEPFTLPIQLESAVSLDRLNFELHWDARRLQLDDLSGTGLSLDASIEEMNLAGRASLRFNWSNGQPAEKTVAILKFTPKGTEEERIPVLLGYGKWLASAGSRVYAVAPRHGSVTIVPDGAKVWPGDTDQSRQVDHNDLLNIGLAYNTSGAARPNAGTAWYGQYAPAWGQTTPVSNSDYKHIDANGDGTVNAADTTAIALNWSQVTTHFREPEDRQPTPKANGAPLLVEGDIISSDQDNVLPIVLGTTAQPAESVYGLAFSVAYRGYISPQRLRVEFVDSWLGGDATPLLTLYRHFPSEKRIDIALVRTNGQSISGFGPIAQLILRGNNQTGNLQSADLETLAAKMIDEREQLLGVTLESTPLSVDFSTSTSEPVWARHIMLSPVPAAGELTIQTGGIVVESLQVLNLHGQILASYPGRQSVIPVQSFTPGVYLLRIRTKSGSVVRRWVKQGE